MAAAGFCCDSPSTVILTSGGTDKQSSASGLQKRCSMSASCPCNTASGSVGFSLDVQPWWLATASNWRWNTVQDVDPLNFRGVSLFPSCFVHPATHTPCLAICCHLSKLAQVSPWSYCTKAQKSLSLSHNCVQTEDCVYWDRARRGERGFPETPYLVLTPHVLQAAWVWLQSVNI
jgi:hypothetical protein